MNCILPLPRSHLPSPSGGCAADVNERHADSFHVSEQMHPNPNLEVLRDTESYIENKSKFQPTDNQCGKSSSLPRKNRTAEVIKVFNNLMKKDSKFSYEQFKATPPTEQIEWLIAAKTLSRMERDKRDKIIEEVSSTIQRNYPQCALHVFGSYATGIAESDSDVDIYVDVNEPARDVRNNLLQIFRHHSQEKNVSRWKHFQLINNAGVVLRMIHSETTQIQCDLSFANPVAVHASQLVQLYIKLDPRVRPFLVLLRTWAKYNGVSGKRKLKKFDLVLIGLAHLMEIGIIPSIHLLQSFDKGEAEQINGWKVLFCKDVNLIRRNFQANDLYKGNVGQAVIFAVTTFFERFSHFDFTQFMICPLLGKGILKNIFLSGEKHNLPEPLQKMSKLAIKQLNATGELCVQDPFQLNRNTARFVSTKVVRKFQKMCRISSQVYPHVRNCQVESFFDVFLSKSTLKAKRATDIPLEAQEQCKISDEKDEDNANMYFVKTDTLTDLHRRVFKLMAVDHWSITCS